MYTSESTTKSDTILANILKYESSEKMVAKQFVDDGWTATSNTAHNCTFDLIVAKDGVPITLEVKDESNYTSSPNICIEGWQGEDHHPSGIQTTRADVGIHILGSESVVYYNPEMSKWIDANKPLVINEFKGADNKNGGWLVRKSQVLANRWCGLFPTVFIPGCRIIQSILRHRSNHV